MVWQGNIFGYIVHVLLYFVKAIEHTSIRMRASSYFNLTDILVSVKRSAVGQGGRGVKHLYKS